MPHSPQHRSPTFPWNFTEDGAASNLSKGDAARLAFYDQQRQDQSGTQALKGPSDVRNFLTPFMGTPGDVSTPYGANHKNSFNAGGSESNFLPQLPGSPSGANSASFPPPSSLNLVPPLPPGNTVTTGGVGTGVGGSTGTNAGTALDQFRKTGNPFNFGSQFPGPSGGSVGGQGGTGGLGFDGLGPAFDQTQTAFNGTSSAFDTAIGTDAFQSGNWFTDLFKGDNALTREGAFGDNGWFNPALQGVGVGLDLWNGIQGNNLARDSLDFQKQAYNQNYQQQLNAYNRATEASANTAFRG